MKKGFTLIEVMIGLVICGILAAIILPVFTCKQDKVVREKCKQEWDQNRNSVDWKPSFDCHDFFARRGMK